MKSKLITIFRDLDFRPVLRFSFRHHCHGIECIKTVATKLIQNKRDAVIINNLFDFEIYCI